LGITSAKAANARDCLKAKQAFFAARDARSDASLDAGVRRCVIESRAARLPSVALSNVLRFPLDSRET